jgi:hypothetical protein
MEVGRAFDFHYGEDGVDYNVRLTSPSNATKVIVTLPSSAGTLCLKEHTHSQYLTNFALSSSNSTLYLVGITDKTEKINTVKTSSTSVYMSGGELYAESDATLKTVIENIDGDPEKIKRIPKVIFHWNNDEEKKRVLGTLAQNVEEVYPEIVTKGEDDIRGVGYDRMGIIALAGIDKLYEMIQVLQSENRELKERIETLEEKLK